MFNSNMRNILWIALGLTMIPALQANYLYTFDGTSEFPRRTATVCFGFVGPRHSNPHHSGFDHFPRCFVNVFQL
jgi:hypothetical protein